MHSKQYGMDAKSALKANMHLPQFNVPFTEALLLIIGSCLCGCCFGAEFVDNPYVIGLWHMETTNFYSSDRNQVVDDDSANPTRDHHLVLGNTGDVAKPQLVAGGLYGKAVSLDGVDDVPLP